MAKPTLSPELVFFGHINVVEWKRWPVLSKFNECEAERYLNVHTLIECSISSHYFHFVIASFYDFIILETNHCIFLAFSISNHYSAHL